jgi:hypothetical protein
MKRKKEESQKLSRLSEQALREAREGVSLLEAAKALLRGDTIIPQIKPPQGYLSTVSSASWIEEQNIINRATAQKVLDGARRGGRCGNPNDLKIWQEFEQLRPNSKMSDSALTAKIGRKYGLARSAAIEARKRGQKLAGL